MTQTVRETAGMVTACGLFVVLVASNAFAGEPPEADVGGYRADVAPLVQKYCIDCHGADDPAAGLSLSSLNPDLLQGDSLETWRMVDEQVRFGDMPPGDADQPSQAERNTLLDWIRQEMRKTQLPGVLVDEKLMLPQFGNYVDHGYLFGRRLPRVHPAPPRLWRLRPEIYDTTMPRLGEGIGGLANGLSVLDGPVFKDYAAGYFIDEAATTPLLSNAKKVAAALVGNRSKDRIFRELVAEPPSNEKVKEAIRYAFRRILDRNATDDEVARFAEFYHRNAQTTDHDIAARSLLAAVLMQPEVLFRQELGDGEPDEFGRVWLSQREIAFALSYALSNQPLGEFFAAAEKGELASRAQVAEIVQRRLQDDSPMQNRNPRLLQFFREYFNYPFAEEVFKDQPEGGTHDSGRLVSDLETTIRDVLHDDRDVLNRLLTGREYYVAARYIEDKGKVTLESNGNRKWSFYHTAFNLPRDWKWSLEKQPIEFPAGERAGVLTHPAWLAAWSGNFENHPVQRGKWIRTHLLGGTVPDVPIGVDARVPEVDHTTFRERLRLATQDARCWRCHRKMDPLGVTFERYDHYGRYQRFDVGQPVDASGRIDRTGVPELDGTIVSGPTEMMEVLARSEHVEQVFVRHVFRYLMGRNETLGDANTLQDAHGAYRDSDGSFRALVAALLSSDSFLLRQSNDQQQSIRSQRSRK